VAQEGFVGVLTPRKAANAAALEHAITARGGDSLRVELDLVSPASSAPAFATIRTTVGAPEGGGYNAGYLAGRDLPPEHEVLDHIPVDLFDPAQPIASRGPFLVAKEGLPAMRQRGGGVLLPAYPRPSLWDARPPMDALGDQAELVRA